MLVSDGVCACPWRDVTLVKKLRMLGVEAGGVTFGRVEYTLAVFDGAEEIDVTGF